jgi:CRP-like cAMP-binding protein
MNRFLRKLQYGSELMAEEQKLILELPHHYRNIDARGDVLSEGDEQKNLILVLDGWACRYKLLENGTRQIISILLPGDLSEPFGLHPHCMDHSLCAITPVMIGEISRAAIMDAASFSRVSDALWWDLFFTISLDRHHIVGLGRRSAKERLAHLICQLHMRLEMIGMSEDDSFLLMMTQAQIGDMLGLSTVQVNRSLQVLRETQLISQHQNRLTIHDLTELCALSGFDRSYFHLDDIKDQTAND